jgi:hypothetical protein
MRIRLSAVLAVSAAAAALIAPGARAAPPANDNRADAAPIPTFPASLPGTLADATVERLDPQVSDCGQIDATVWYRVDQAPDGAIVLGIQGALAPVIRVYRASGSSLKEIDCAAATAGQRAQVSFESVRGATFLVIVGRKPQTTGTEFALDAKLFLPPPNDSWKNAQTIGKLPWKVAATTLGATQDSTDPCDMAGGTVWYTTTPKEDGRLAFRLAAAGDFDAVLAVQQRARSERRTVGCARTDKSGRASLPVDLRKGTTYLVAVGNLAGSPPGNFVLDALAAQAPERAPGAPLAAAGVHSSVNGLTDVNDMWWRTLQPGTTYRISFHGKGCPSLVLWSMRLAESPVGVMGCNSYRTFTPGPDGGGKYVFEVRAPRSLVTQTYSLVVAQAGEDDLGLGVELPNLATRHGALAPAGVDVLDRYHFDVAATSDVRLTLRYPAGRQFAMLLVTDDGRRVASGDREIQRLLQPGRYVLAIGGVPGSASGSYAVALVIRQLTATTAAVSSGAVTRGAAVTIAASTAPAPDGGVVTVQIDRFDPLGGWVFSRIMKLRAPGGSITWAPPALGRWRVRASYDGNLHFAHSTSAYVYVVAK